MSDPLQFIRSCQAAGAPFIFDPQEWSDFVDGVRNGVFDLPSRGAGLS